ncbi:MAG TPA: amidohydrolase family protein [Pyrinomonadaceae bacterium]|jgi:5-methylthioadenosine/S-adenosylhomocysteine deaminase
MTKIYCARWVVPVAAPPVADGAVAVNGARVAAVGTRADVAAQFPAAAVEDFGAAVILPGLVNCHAHLELTVMRGFLDAEEGDFFAWLRKLTVARTLRMTADDLRASAAWGALEAARAGVTCVADGASGGTPVVAALKELGLRGTVFQEVFGPDARMAREQWARSRAQLEALRADADELVRVGVSPHAPYTVSAPLFELITDYALTEGVPLTLHAAESEAESLLLSEGRGPFAESYAQRGIEWRAPGLAPVQYLARLGVLAARPLLAHCIRVDDADIETIRQAGASVAHCPKSNAKLGHGHAPYDKFLALRHGLGSDSVASNNTCDLLEEARTALLMGRAAAPARLDELTAERALYDATAGGAEALGYGGQTGALVAGRAADLVAVRLDGAHQQPVHDPVRALVHASSGRDVIMTMVAGRELVRDGRALTVDEARLRARVNEIATRLNVE